MIAGCKSGQRTRKIVADEMPRAERLFGQFQARVEAHAAVHVHAVAFGLEQVFALAEVRLLQELLRLLEERDPGA